MGTTWLRPLVLWLAGEYWGGTRGFGGSLGRRLVIVEPNFWANFYAVCGSSPVGVLVGPAFFSSL